MAEPVSLHLADNLACQLATSLCLAAVSREVRIAIVVGRLRDLPFFGWQPFSRYKLADLLMAVRPLVDANAVGLAG